MRPHEIRDVNDVTPFISSFMNQFFKTMIYFKEVVFQFIQYFNLEKYFQHAFINIKSDNRLHAIRIPHNICNLNVSFQITPTE